MIKKFIDITYCRAKYLLVLHLFLQDFSVSAQQLVDRQATPATVQLYKSLFQIQKQGVVFGHQDALAYGVGWKGLNNTSDVKLVTGEHPGLLGLDIGDLELKKEKNLDGVPFRSMRNHILSTFQRGGMVTISWHARNPLTAGNTWDTTHGTVAAILPGGSKHQLYISWLDQAAQFFQSLKTASGTPIPILFRPYHELTGNWFWWCKNTCTSDEFKSLWKFTVEYFRDVKGIHQLIYVFNTADFSSPTNFLERYPGDEWVDVLSFDRYQYEGAEGRNVFFSVMDRQLEILGAIGQEKAKPIALAETGYETIPDSNWWTTTLYPLLRKTPLAYVLVWRNHGFMKSANKYHYYAPYPGHPSNNDFNRFCRLPDIFLERRLSSFKIYR
jgi:mannan endo-1,4-beta-mannosidase